MDTQELRTLKLLEEIDGDQAPSQRALATSMNISLGLVNSFIKRLVQKGYFKVTNIPKNRVKYILTPKGATEKTRLTYEYIQYSFQFYKNTRKKLRGIFQQFEKQRIKQVVFFGMGELAEIAFICLNETNVSLSAVVDIKMAGKRFFGTTVLEPSAIGKLTFDRILVTTMEPSGDAVKTIFEQGISRNRIRLLA